VQRMPMRVPVRRAPDGSTSKPCAKFAQHGFAARVGCDVQRTKPGPPHQREQVFEAVSGLRRRRKVHAQLAGKHFLADAGRGSGT